MDNKKLFTLLGGVIAIFVLLLLILWLVSKLKPTYISYAELESKIVDASKHYVKDNESKFANDNTKYSLTYQNLVNGGYIKPMNELLENSNGCNANVIVNKQDGQYTFTPYLNCGENYKTIELYKQIIADNPVVTSGSGLYRGAKGDYYFRGRSLNNYVAFGSVVSGNTTSDVMWQILSITSDNKVRLRALKYDMNLKFSWDKRYNVNQSNVTGYNTFDDSFIAEKLEELYNGNKLFTAEQKTKMSPRKLCVSPRSLTDNTKDGSTECSKLSTKEYYIGGLTPYEYMRISLDDDCKTVKDGACRNFNFISDNVQSSEWTLTPTVDNDYKVYSFDGRVFYETKASTMKYVYAIIDLNELSFYKSGDGSKDNPYRIKMVSTNKKNTNKK